MKLLTLVVVVFTILCGVECRYLFHRRGASCGSGWISFPKTGHCYKLHLTDDDELTWKDARLKCINHGGYLITADPPLDEMNFLAAEVRKVSSSWEEFWTGGKRNDKNAWVWDQGPGKPETAIAKEITKKLWDDTNNSNDVGQDRMILYVGTAAKKGKSVYFSSFESDTELKYICEKDV